MRRSGTHVFSVRFVRLHCRVRGARCRMLCGSAWTRRTAVIPVFALATQCGATNARARSRLELRQSRCPLAYTSAQRMVRRPRVIGTGDPHHRPADAPAPLQPMGNAVNLSVAASTFRRQHHAAVAHDRWIGSPCAMCRGVGASGRHRSRRGDIRRIKGSPRPAMVHTCGAEKTARPRTCGPVSRLGESCGAAAREGLNHCRHSREGGNPASLASEGLKSLDPRLRGNDGQKRECSDLP